MTIWCQSNQEFNALTASLEPWRQLVEPHLLNTTYVTGFCCACQKTTQLLTAPEPPPGEWKNLLEGMQCECGLNARMRLCLKIIKAETTRLKIKRAVILEKLTPLFPFVQGHIPNIVGCEFLGQELAAGSVQQLPGHDVRHENFMALSFRRKSLDLLLHFDVLEHVPDAVVALREAHRVLKPGGKMIFSCPFYHNLPNNLVRAKVENGELLHILEPCYHGNPVSEKGSLVYIHPTWEIIDILNDIGFSEVRVGLTYSLAEGIVSNGCPYEDGHTWPVVIVAIK